LLETTAIREEKELGLGVVNPRTPEIEPVEAIEARIREALSYLPPEKIFVNPDCGLKTREWAQVEPALTEMVAAAKTARAKLAGAKKAAAN